MHFTRHSLIAVELRVAFWCWAVALVLAAAIAIAIGWAQWWRIDRDRSLSAAEEQMDALHERIVPLYDRPRIVLERQLLNGRHLSGKSSTTGGGTHLRPDSAERGLFQFRPGSPEADGETGGGINGASAGGRQLLLSTLDASTIDSRFAGWTLRLKFVDDRLVGASAFNPALSALRRPVAALRPVQRIAEGVLVVAAAAAVLCMTVACFVGTHWRPIVASIGLAGGMLAVVVACLHSEPLDRQVVHERTVLGTWLLLLVALGWMALLPGRRRRLGHNRPLCRCGYNLTANVSGVCPECGRLTGKGRVDRWAAEADAIGRVTLHTPARSGNSDWRIGEVKPDDVTDARAEWTSAPAQIAATLPGTTLTCYRLRMADAVFEPGDDSRSSRTAHGPTGAFSPPGDALPGETFACPNCGGVLDPGSERADDEGLIACPSCGYRSSYADDVSVADRELALRMEVEQRTRDAQLNEVRVKQVLTERRSLFRMRSYFVALAVTAAVAGGQLGIWMFGRVARRGVDLFAIGYGVTILGMAVAVAVCLRRIRRYNVELRTPVQTEPTTPPDFSTLSDGSQRFDEAAQNLERLYGRPKP